MQQLQMHSRAQSHAASRAGRRPRPFAGAVRVSCSATQGPAQPSQPESSRRNALLSMLSVPLVAAQLGSGVAPAEAFIEQMPAGFRLYNDKLDGYSFVCPDTWIAVTSSGNDIFLRNPRSVEENLFVDLTSPSSSRYTAVTDLGSPKDAANRLLDQYLTKEFMSTRLGIARYGEVVSASSRVAEDGKTYYDIALRMTSYGSRNAYAATRAEVLETYALEWDRTLVAVLGAANNRLYTLRLQSASGMFAKEQPTLKAIMDSFRVREVEVV